MLSRLSFRIPSLVALFMLTAILFPKVAAACIYNPNDNKYCDGVPCPYPACEVNDIPLKKRVDQLNNQLIGKMATAFTNISFVMREISEWKKVYDTATNWKDTFNHYYGRLTVNPMPSLAMAWNTSNFGLYATLDSEGNVQVSDQIQGALDIAQYADSIMNWANDDQVLDRLYNSGRGYADRLATMGSDYAGREYDLLMNDVKATLDHQRYLREASDSLQAVGSKIAERYTTGELAAEGKGDSEAMIEGMSAALTRAKATSFEANIVAQRARNQSLLFNLEAAEHYKRHYARKKNYNY